MLFVGLVFVCVIIALMFIDAEHMILPNVITYPFFVFAFAVRIVYPIAFGTVFSDMTYWPLVSMSAYPAWVVSLVGAILGAVAGGGSLWLVGAIWKKLRGVEAMGLGDVKMMAGVGRTARLEARIVVDFPRSLCRRIDRDRRNNASKG